MVKRCRLHAILLSSSFYISTYFINFLEDLTHTLHLFKLNKRIHAGDSLGNTVYFGFCDYGFSDL